MEEGLLSLLEEMSVAGLMLRREGSFGVEAHPSGELERWGEEKTGCCVDWCSYSEELGKWIEVGNSGMFRPEMLRPMGLPEGVNVIAWGLGLERCASSSTIPAMAPLPFSAQCLKLIHTYDSVNNLKRFLDCSVRLSVRADVQQLPPLCPAASSILTVTRAATDTINQ